MEKIPPKKIFLHIFHANMPSFAILFIQLGTACVHHFLGNESRSTQPRSQSLCNNKG